MIDYQQPMSTEITSQEDVKLAMVVAMDERNAIGRDNALPWHLPCDLKHFKALTIGHPVLMGRLTYESIGKPLPGRTNIVVSRAKAELPGLAKEHVFSDLAEAVVEAKQAAFNSKVDTVMIIGGAKIYAQLIQQADALYITHVQTAISNADAHFPDHDLSSWKKTVLAKNHADHRNEFSSEFVRYDRLPSTMSV